MSHQKNYEETTSGDKLNLLLESLAKAYQNLKENTIETSQFMCLSMNLVAERLDEMKKQLELIQELSAQLNQRQMLH
ncbi:hypothetical protein LJC56_06160 [Christensenellaceae bacterium OttesenSCG-928-K19]|nr:hypothetical protein [Christensenellaceae bacterium OttesenSCG-928-K19]